MTADAAEPTRRFSDRADDYARARPGYPEALVDTLAAEARLAPGAAVADLGSGTGISSEPFLRRGCAVYGVEPNAAMREAAERRFADEPRFTSVAGTADATTLASASVDLVTIAQAFHWLDPERTRREVARILRPTGIAAVFWNWRRMTGSPFVEAYEGVLHRYGTDYAAVRRRYGARDEGALRALFGGPYATRTFAHAQALDLAGLTALIQSASYTPAAGHPDRAPMLRALEEVFDAHQRDGRVEMPYDAELHYGPLTRDV